MESKGLHSLVSRMSSQHATKQSSLVACLLLACLILCTLSIHTHASESQQQSEAKLEQLKKNVAALSSWLKKANKEKSGLITELQKQEKQISATTKAIESNKQHIRQLLKELNQLNQDLKTQKKALNTQQHSLKEELRALYLEGNQPRLKALLDQDNPQSSARYLAYFEYLNDARSENIGAFKDAVAKLEKTQASILRRQTDIKKQRQALETKRSNLNLQKKQRQTTLAKLEKNIQGKSSELDRLKQDQARLEALLIEVEKAISEIELPDESRPFSQQKSKLPWPTRGKVLERFGSRIAKGKLRSNGIRIAAKGDSEVKSVHYGRVIFSDWLRGFGLLIIIDHGEGYMSLYGNNNSLVRDVGDWVRPGEAIAYAGSSGGQSRSSLYFEIRKNGKPQNPNRWLKK